MYPDSGNSLPLSPYQELFFYEWELVAEGYYNMFFIQELQGQIDRDRLNIAWEKMIMDVLSFRSSILKEHSELSVNILDKFNSVVYIDHPLVLEEIKLLIKQPFNLVGQKNLLRLYVIKTDVDSYRILFVFHHFIGGGMTTNVIVDLLSHYYNNPHFQYPVSLEIQQQENLIFLRKTKSLLDTHRDKLIDFWRRNIGGGEGISLDFLKGTSTYSQGETKDKIFRYYPVPIKYVGSIKHLVRQYHTTEYVFHLTLFAILFHKYVYEPPEKLLLSIPYLINNKLYIQGVNTVLIPFAIKSTKTFLNILEDTHLFFKVISQSLIAGEDVLPAYTPTYLIMETAGIHKDSSLVGISKQPPLSKRIYHFNGMKLKEEKYPISESSMFSGHLHIRIQRVDEQQIHFFIDTEDIDINIELVDSFFQRYFKLLEDVLSDASKTIGEYNMITDKEYQYLVYDYNKTEREYPKDKTIHQLFEEQVARTPNNIAVVFEEKELTYQELNNKANQLAYYLYNNYQTKADDIICLLLKRNEWTIIAILGVLKSGAAYCPISPEYPEERILFILQDTQPRCLITNCKSKIENVQFLIVNVTDEQFLKELYSLTINHLPLIISSHELAYIIYTSGTTGNPKGVMIEHSSVINLQMAQSRIWLVPIKENKIFRLLLYANYSFDAFVFELFASICNGHTSYLISSDIQQDFYLLANYIQTNNIEIATLPPAILQKDVFLSLDKMILAGESPNIDIIKRYYEQEIEVFNAYGPTETTVCATMHHYSMGDSNNNIGKHIDNKSIYVLNNNLQLLPIGSMGELYIGGDGVARGYLNRPELTAERFIKNPFQTEEEKQQNRNGRLYKTGDIVRMLPDGNIEYIGRNDFQVKIRGYRIELGEIETRIQGFQTRIEGLKDEQVIEQAVVLVNEKGDNKYLVGYFVAKEQVDVEELRSYLSKQLPEYMVPTGLVQIEQMPLTVNGKLDRKALLAIEYNLADSNEYKAPTNELEQQLLSIWEKLLGNNNIGVEDDFFRVGGDSIRSIQLSSQLRAHMGVDISVKDIFQYRTIAQLSEQISFNFREKDVVREPGRLEGEVGLLPIQKWFFEKDYPNPDYFNQAFEIKTELLNKEVLIQAIAALVDYHDAFRLSYKKDEAGNIIQYYDSTKPMTSVVFYNLTNYKDKVSQKRIWYNQGHQGLDIWKGNLYKIFYMEDEEEKEAYIGMIFHHLIIDGVSWRILYDDLFLLYQGKSLGDKKTSYRQWVNSLLEYSAQIDSSWDAIYKEWAIKWQEQNEEFTRWSDNEDNCFVTVSLSKEETEQLIYQGNKPYHTEINDLLLYSLVASFRQVFGKSDLFITLESHGREEWKEEIRIGNTMGWFTTMHPVCLSVGEDISESIISIKERLHSIERNGLGYGIRWGYSHMPCVVFNYLGVIDGKERQQSWSLKIKDTGIWVDSKNLTIQENRLQIGSVVENGQFRFTMAGRLSKEKMGLWGQAWEMELKNMIQHLLKRNAVIYSPSDFKDIRSEVDVRRLIIEPNKEKLYDWFEMTDLQKAYLLGRLDNFEIGGISNTIYMRFCFSEIDIKELNRALNQLIVGQPALRTIFSMEILKQRYLRMEEIDVYTIEEINLETEPYTAVHNEEIANRVFRKDYDAGKFPLFHFVAVRYNDIVVLHHSMDLIILDAQSRQSFWTILIQLYKNKDYQPAFSAISFKDYQDIVSQLRYSSWYERDKRYWEEKLSNMPGKPPLLGLEDTSWIKKAHFSEHTLFVDKSTWMSFCKKIESYRLSPAGVILALFGKVIGYYSGVAEFLITITLFNRYHVHKDVNQLWGDFTNTDFFHFLDVGGLFPTIERTSRRLLDDIEHQLYGGQNVQRDWIRAHVADIHKIVSPIVFTGVFNTTGWNDNIVDKEKYFPGEYIEKRYSMGQTSQAWIDLQAIGTEEGFSSKWLFVSELFSKEQIGQMNGQMIAWIEWLSKNDWKEKCVISPLSAFDRNCIFEYEERGRVLAPKIERSWLQEYEEKVIQNLSLRDRVSVIDSEQNRMYTHKEIWDLSKKIASILVSEDRTTIAILSEKGMLQVVSAIGIMQSGQAYIPLNIHWSVSRILEIMEESGTKVLLISKKEYEHKIQLQGSNIRLLIIEELLLKEQEGDISLPAVLLSDIAYIIYTSGSTGKPKGVAISHENMINTLIAVNNRYKVTEKDSVLALSELSFDLSVYDIFGLLLVGGGIVFVNDEERQDPRHWLALIEKHKITLWNTVPQLAELLVDEARAREMRLDSIRLYLLSGDWLPLQLPDKIKRQSKDTQVISLGGATEGSVWSIWYEIKNINPDWKSIPYGYPMPNQQIYILNHELIHSPVGVEGDIYIGGKGVAQGYWNNQEQTDKQFKEHHELGKIYKTGDRGILHAEGWVEFRGRKDFQVKIRGYRVELEEIENKLNKLEGVKQSAVQLFKKNNSEVLVGFVVREQLITKGVDENFDKEVFKLEQRGIRKGLNGTIVLKENVSVDKLSKVINDSLGLPDYMSLQEIVFLDSMPLTANGKLDKSRLPKPEIEWQSYIAPVTKEEQEMVEIWSEVLNIDKSKIGIEDSFFNLGGHSITAIRLISKINSRFNFGLSFKDLFEYPTIRGLIKNSITLKQREQEGDYIPYQLIDSSVIISKEDYEDCYPAGMLQLGMFFEQEKLGKGIYLFNYIQQFSEKCDRKKIEKCLQAIMNRHDILRTGYRMLEDGNIYAMVQKRVEVKSKLFFVTDSIEEVRKKEIALAFNREIAGLYRFYIIEQVEGFVLFFSFHHAILDGYSLNLFIRELVDLYQHDNDKLYEEEQIQLLYGEFIRNELSALKNEDTRLFWREYLAESILLTPQWNFSKSNGVSVVAERQQIEGLRLGQIEDIASKYSCTVEELLLLSYMTVLSLFFNERDITIGLEKHNRIEKEGGDRQLGLFVTMLPFRYELRDKEALGTALSRLRDSVKKIVNHKQYPYNEIKQQLGGRDLFDIAYSYNDFSHFVGHEKRTHINEFLNEELSNITSILFICKVYKYSGGYGFVFSGHSNSVDQAYLSYFVRYYNSVLDQLCKEERVVFKLMDEDHQYLVYDYNKTERDYPKDKTIHQLFEEQVTRTPNNIAVVFEDKQLTYQELNNKANQLANYLYNNYQTKGDDIICLLLERSEWMIIAILGVFKSGAAYCPISPEYPEERILFVLQDTQPKCLITNCKLKIENVQFPIVNVTDEQFLKELYSFTINHLPLTISSRSLAYIIYTSGTTGNPKGVMIEHGGVINLIYALDKSHFWQDEERMLNFFSYIFDPSVEQFFIPLLKGFTLFMISEELIQDVNGLINFINKNKITHFDTTPSYFDSLPIVTLATLNRLILGGERLTKETRNKAYKTVLDNTLFFNEYGPTETTITSLVSSLNNTIDLNIGSPISNTCIYILNKEGLLLPQGSVGELYIGGDGVARGYLNRPELTAERFIKNPFQTEEEKQKNRNSRLYKTGDVVRMLPDGNIEYIGRNDFQVKIRGYRIELGEIETRIEGFQIRIQGFQTRIEGLKDEQVIEQAVVLVNEKADNKYLVGYFVAKEQVDVEELRSYLSKQLPEYMVPTGLVQIEQMPLTVNGKLDRKALLNIEYKIIDESIELPKNNTEERLLKIWSNLLKISELELSVTQSFFRLGGNSLLSIRLVGQLNRELLSQLSIKDIFAYPTIREISYIIEQKDTGFVYQDYMLTDIKKEDYSLFPLNNVQQAYYMGRIDLFEIGNISTGGYSEFVVDDLSVENLEKALNRLVLRHAGLRTVFTDQGQQILPADNCHYSIPVNKITTEEALLDIRNRLLNMKVDVARFPIIVIEVSEYKGSYVIHFMSDAIIMDDNSMRIFFTELVKIYNNLDIVLPTLHITYHEYILALQRIRDSKLFDKAKTYWETKLEDYDFSCNLPIVIEPSMVKQSTTKRGLRIIEKETYDILQEKLAKIQLSPTSLLLSLYGKVLCRWSGQDKFSINLTLFNRLPLHKEVNDILGDFTNLELYNYDDVKSRDIVEHYLKGVQNVLWDDIENNLFDGIDFQRLIRERKQWSISKAIAPIVLTSVLGFKEKKEEGDVVNLFGRQHYSISRTSQVWIDNAVYEDYNGNLILRWDFVEQLFLPEVIEGMLDEYAYLIRKIAAMDIQRDRLECYRLPATYQHIIEKYNATVEEYDVKTIIDFYDNCVIQDACKCNAIAVVEGGNNKKAYKHREVAIGSKNIATHLYKYYKEEQTVAILSEKGYNQVVSSLGIMQSGKAYIPLNIHWSVSRILEIMEESGTKVLLISKKEYEHKRQLQVSNIRLLIIEELLLKEREKNIHLPIVLLSDIAYIIYTSGSTGKPKGVAISHENMMNTIVAVNNRYKVTEKDSVLALSELSFDLSVYDIFGLLLVGGRIVFVNDEERQDPQHWLSLIEKHKITLWNTVPQLAELLVDEARTREMRLDSIRLYLLSGDWLPLQLPDKIKRQSKDTQVISLGGATEGSIWSIWYEIKNINPDWKSIPYGYPMPNQQIYILNHELIHSPIGVEGDIYIGGKGVAQGYWNNEEETKKQFVVYPELGRIYKTGDRGILHAEGWVEFRGRKDFQVKIRGYRVELEEIENKLNKLEGVKQSAVQLFKKNNSEVLVGFVVREQLITKGADENFDKEVFKLEQRGIRKDLTDTITFNDNGIDEELYRLTKSYRNFGDRFVDALLIDTIIREAKQIKVKTKNVVDSLLTKDKIARVLTRLQGKSLSDKILPKYLYPSGGSAYPIECYVRVSESGIKGIEGGAYYYHPLNNALQRVEDHSNNDQDSIELVVNWSAIKPLYGDFADKLVWIELGHILELLSTELNRLGITFDIQIKQENRDESKMVLAEIVLGVDGNQIEQLTSELTAYYVSKRGNVYEGLIDLDKYSVFERAIEQAKILDNGKGMIVVECDSRIDKACLVSQWIGSGIMIERIKQQLLQYNIGGCLLGSEFGENELYSIVIGYIANEEKTKGESKVAVEKLSKVINDSLGLPDYMSLQEIVFLDSMPLTANGKLDKSRLPDPEIEWQSYIAPVTKEEQEMVEIWSEILNIGKNKIGIEDSFFNLGGHSITAIRLISKINSRFNFGLSFKDLFEYPTIRGLIKNSITLKQREQEGDYIPYQLIDSSVVISKEDYEDCYPAGMLQLGMFFEQEKLGHGTYLAFQIQYFSGKCNREKLERCLQTIINRHDILRTGYRMLEDGNIYVMVQKRVEVKGKLFFVTDSIEEVRKKEIALAFNREIAGLYRFYIIEQAEGFVLFFSFHHAILDGYSLNLFIRELADLYQHDNDKLYEEEQSKLLYGEFIRNELSALKNEDTRLFWREYLAESILLTPQWNFSKSNRVSVVAERQQIEGLRLRQIEDIASKYSCTVEELLLLSYMTVLSLFFNERDITIGLEKHNRIEKEGGDRQLGLFVTMLPFRYELRDKEALGTALSRLRDSVKNIVNHKQYPYNEIKQQLGGRDLFDIAYSYNDFSHFVGNEKRTHINEFLNEELSNITSILFICKVYKYSGGYGFVFSGHSNNIDQAYLSYFVRYYNSVLDQLCKEERVVFKLMDEDYQYLVYDYNKTEREYPKDKTIHQLFEEQVARTPNNIAVIFEEKQLTYQELNDKANQLANYLYNNYQTKADDIICLLLERSEWMIVAILGVLKSGAAYCPISPEYSEERILFILQDTQPKCLITNCKLKNEHVQFAIVNVTDEQFLKELYSLTIHHLPLTISSHALAYIIYTSGTTGNPKGVMIEHVGVINLIYALDKSHFWQDEERILNFFSYIFDPSVEQFFIPLLKGFTLFVISEELIQDVDGLINFINKNEITHFHTTPSYFNSLPIVILPTLNRLILGGERVTNEIRNKVYKTVLDNTFFLNEYGPTETTITSLVSSLNNTIDLNIGYPISNTCIYILNKEDLLLPQGSIGELYIGGDGLARGYLNRAELTEEKFISNPFQTEEDKKKDRNSKLYKTGDLVRMLSDGNIEYIGRNDFQVKIRGYRIELGEIENRIQGFQTRIQGFQDFRMIEQAVVLVNEKGNNKYLVGYFVAKEQVDVEELISYLSKQLPDYMVPTGLVQIERMPLTVNGKLDRKALLAIEYNLTDSKEYKAPKNELEQQLLSIWEKLLGNNNIGVQDDFFRVGGDSIKSIQLSSRVRSELGKELSVKDVFEHRTIERMLAHVLSNHQIKVYLSEQGKLSGELSLLPIQQYFFELKLTNEHHYNQSFLIETPELEIEKLKIAIEKVVEHHDAFRLTYRKDAEGNIIQYYDSKKEAIPLDVLDISEWNVQEGTIVFEEKLKKQYTSWQDSFNIYERKTYQIAYIHGYKNKTARIFIAAHHLIIDAVSWRILLEDIETVYSGKKLLAKRTSYRQWVNIGKDYVAHYPNELSYWEGVEKKVQENIAKLSSKITIQEESYFTIITIDRDITNYLLLSSNQVFYTEINNLLLTALARALGKLFNEQEVSILLEGHGRESLQDDIDISKTMGWFTSIIPIHLPIYDNVQESIIEVKEELRRIPNKGIGYGFIRGYKHLPKISFNYLGVFKKEEQQDWFLTNESSGISVSNKNKSNLWLDINGGVGVNGVLVFSIRGRLTKEYIDNLSIYFKQEMIAIANYIQSFNRSYLTPSDTHYIVSKDLLNRLQQENEIQAIYVANSLQAGFIYHYLSKSEGDDAYKVQLLWKYKSQVNEDYFIQSWQQALDRYPGLRVRFNWEEEIVQIIDKKVTLDYRFRDIQDKRNKEKVIEAIRIADRKEDYDLAKGNLLRVYLIQVDKEEFVVLYSNHHAISDGWSNPNLLNYIHEFYNSLINQNTPVELLEDQAYLRAQEYLQVKSKNNIKDKWWVDYLSGVERTIDLRGLRKQGDSDINLLDYKFIQEHTSKGVKVIDKEYSALSNFIKQEGLTWSNLIMWCWSKALSVYDNRNENIIGITLSGRSLPINDIEQSVGLYINTLPLVVRHSSNESILNILKNIQKDTEQLNQLTHTNLSSLNSNTLDRLFATMVVYENYPIPIKKDNQEANTLTPIFLSSVEKTDYPLTVLAYEKDSVLSVEIKYAGELFEEKQIERLLKLMSLLLQQIPIGYNKLEQELRLIDNEEYNYLVYDYNKTEKEYPKDKTIHQLFEEQVARTPNNIAVVFEEKQLTYQELNDKANQLANYLHNNYQTKADDIICLLLERSEWMIIAILGVLKSGAAYCPISPEYPEKRILFVLQDTQPKCLITNCRLKIENVQLPIVNVIDEQFLKELYSLTINHLPLIISSHALAYIIYTSGITGSPKGVMIAHVTFSHAIQNLIALFSKSLTSFNTYSTTNYTFDIFGLEYTLPLLHGNVLTLGSMHENLNLNLYDFIQITPTVLQSYLSTINKINPNLIWLIGGEKVPMALLTDILKRSAKREINIYNVYGPTETTIWSVVYFYNRRAVELGIESIGKPIDNTVVYILDSDKRLLPMGAMGELYIGGDGVARGYLNRPELTAERFIKNPFQTEEEKQKNRNSKLYKTGDLVRMLPDGNIEYIGRNDFQVKIRGYRIELGEIENRIQGFQNRIEGLKDEQFIEQVVVLVNEKADNKYLVGYFVAKEKVDVEELRSYLSKQLPEYMVPIVLLQIEQMPLTINGKLDRKILLDMDANFVEDNMEAPTNKLELRILQIFATLLSLESNTISVNNSFFRLGGNSILSIRLASLLNREFGTFLSVVDIFKYPTIRELAVQVNYKKTSFDLILMLNNSVAKQIIYMVHPGGGGAEVYYNMAYRLQESYRCYGIGNYNLFSENKMSDISLLAKYYLHEIKNNTTIEPCILLGWSLGGKIALEMAYHLEQQGIKDIVVYLLDTIVMDETLTNILNKKDLSFRKQALNELLDNLNVGEDYKQRTLANRSIEEVLNNDALTGKLIYSRCVLFKAMLSGKDEIADFFQYKLSLPYNNVDKYVSIENIEVIEMQVSHQDIIKKEDEIVDVIKQRTLLKDANKEL